MQNEKEACLKLLSTKSTKAQVAYEFLVLLFILTFAFTTWTLYFSERQDLLRKDIIKRDAETIGREIQDVLYDVRMKNPGFERTMQTPPKIKGEPYSMTTKNKRLTIDILNASYTFQIPDTTGTITKGNNTIRRQEENLCINC